MRKLVLISFLFLSCKTLEYPIVTKYKEPRVRYVKTQQSRVKHKSKPNWDLFTFTLGGLLGFYYISNAK